MTIDVLIVGGGLVGSALALSLAQQGVSCHIIEQSPRSVALDDGFDGRSSAISEASRRVLDAIGVWDAIVPSAEPILDIRVVDGYSSALVHYDHAQIGEDPFGFIVPNTAIRAQLLGAAEKCDGITIHYEQSASELVRDSSGVTATLNDGTVINAALLVAADGRFSKTRSWAGIDHRVVTYGQTAIVCTIDHEKPHQGLAMERFLPVGPFAVLPMTEQRSCIVWTEKHDMAQHMIGLDDAVFNYELSERIGDWLGDVKVSGKRFAYPLTLVMAERYVDERIALVGDAAHGIHPIAGQGVNLGYRDVAALSECIVETKRLGLDIGAATNLDHYQQWRNFDATSVSLVMDGLNRLFSTDNLMVRAARRFGLRAVEQMPELKGFFMLHSMGLMGDLPSMLQDDSAQKTTHDAA